jgi:hypothetical protein
MGAAERLREEKDKEAEAMGVPEDLDDLRADASRGGFRVTSSFLRTHHNVSSDALTREDSGGSSDSLQRDHKLPASKKSRPGKRRRDRHHRRETGTPPPEPIQAANLRLESSPGTKRGGDVIKTHHLIRKAGGRPAGFRGGLSMLDEGIKAACRQFASNGQCRFGSECHFSH